MNTDYIKKLLIMFNNKSVYEIETALAIYEFMDNDINSISDEEIFKVYDLIHSQDEIFDDYVKEEIQRIKEDHDKEERIFKKKRNKIHLKNNNFVELCGIINLTENTGGEYK